ncbi:MAG: hypothetical protein AVDCRST_MAG93-3503, partial [uncultured Chloroflexia bacterium]
DRPQLSAHKRQCVRKRWRRFGVPRRYSHRQLFAFEHSRIGPKSVAGGALDDSGGPVPAASTL